MVVVVVMVIVTFALQHMHGDIVRQSEAIVTLCVNVERDHAVLSVVLV